MSEIFIEFYPFYTFRMLLSYFPKKKITKNPENSYKTRNFKS